MRTIILLIFASLAMGITTTVQAQKTVAAVVKFVGSDTSVVVSKNDNFLVELWIPNRKNYEWSISRQAANCKFTRSQIGEAATMPGAPEQYLWFFKASQKGTDSLTFVYKSPYEGEPTVEKRLKVIVQ